MVLHRQMSVDLFRDLRRRMPPATRPRARRALFARSRRVAQLCRGACSVECPISVRLRSRATKSSEVRSAPRAGPTRSRPGERRTRTARASVARLGTGTSVALPGAGRHTRQLLHARPTRRARSPKPGEELREVHQAQAPETDVTLTGPFEEVSQVRYVRLHDVRRAPRSGEMAHVQVRRLHGQTCVVDDGARHPIPPPERPKTRPEGGHRVPTHGSSGSVPTRTYGRLARRRRTGPHPPHSHISPPCVDNTTTPDVHEFGDDADPVVTEPDCERLAQLPAVGRHINGRPPECGTAATHDGVIVQQRGGGPASLVVHRTGEAVLMSNEVNALWLLPTQRPGKPLASGKRWAQEPSKPPTQPRQLIDHASRMTVERASGPGECWWHLSSGSGRRPGRVRRGRLPERSVPGRGRCRPAMIGGGVRPRGRESRPTRRFRRSARGGVGRR